MEKEFEAFEKKRPDPGRPRTLWEELEALGEELVDFLEESAPEATTTNASTDPFGTETRTTSSSSSGSARRKDKTASASYAASSSRTTSSSASAGSASSASARARAPPPKRESVDEMLEKLKRDMGMK